MGVTVSGVPAGVELDEEAIKHSLTGASRASR